MRHTTICVASLLGGMIIGSALAMLLTPQSGPALRHKIKDFVDEEVDKMKMKADEIHDRLKAGIEEARCKCEEHPTQA